MPDEIEFLADAKALRVGRGIIAPVDPAVWEYRIGGRQVIRRWFGYRSKNPTYKRSSPLNDIVQLTWTPQMTAELLELITVLTRCIDLEGRQVSVLSAVMNGQRILLDDLHAADLPREDRALIGPLIGGEGDGQLPLVVP